MKWYETMFVIVALLVGAIVAIAGLLSLLWGSDLRVLGWGLEVYLILSGAYLVGKILKLFLKGV